MGKYKTSLILGVLSFIYLALLSAKQWTWIFVSQDSGDWLASAQMWFTPQPYGSPLYIFLAKAVNTLPVDLVQGMTILLSALPAAVAVGVTYLIAYKETNDRFISFTASLVLIGCAVFLTQSTIVEEYAISVMFMALAVLAYQHGKVKTWLLMLSLGAAVHIIFALLSVVWVLMEWQRWKELVKYIWIPVIFGLLPYSFVLITMALDTPRFIAGELTLEGVNTWLGSTNTIASLAAVDAPTRLIQSMGVLITSFGMALIPLWIGFKKRHGRMGAASAAMIIITWFLYLTNLDFTTWTFTSFSLPFVILFISIGMMYIPRQHVKVVMVGALVLISLNGYFLNADRVARLDPMATDFEQAVMGVPDGSGVITPRGCATGLGLIYIISQGKDVAPILLYPTAGEITERVYTDYSEWLSGEYAIEGRNTLELAQDALDDGRELYFAAPVLEFWEKAFELVPTDNRMLYKVISVNLNPDWSGAELETYK